MTMEEIRDMLSAFRDGGIVKKLQAEITQLKVERAELKKKSKNLKMQKCNNEII
jgi:uncharacterized protein (DUF3084 family)